MTNHLTTSWAMLVALGAFHGINPGMGWLFAVALGMQERRRGAVIRALLPLGVGHALAVAAAVMAAWAVGAVVPIGSLRWPVAGALVSLGAMRLVRHSHPRWASMRVGMGGLTLWSFLMASAHGAGLMVVPVFVGMTMAGGEHAHHMMPGASAGAAVAATALHAAGYLVVTACVALLVFEKLGVGLLRRAWFNVESDLGVGAHGHRRPHAVAVEGRPCVTRARPHHRAPSHARHAGGRTRRRVATRGTFADPSDAVVCHILGTDLAAARAAGDIHSAPIAEVAELADAPA